MLVARSLLFFAFRSHRHALIVLVNLPLALAGGVFAVALGGGVLSVASLVGFITRSSASRPATACCSSPTIST